MKQEKNYIDVYKEPKHIENNLIFRNVPRDN